MSADTRTTRMRRIPIPVALLIGANALTQFAIQAWMAYGFAALVWKLRHPLPWIAPVALDVFAVTMMVLTYHLRNAPPRTRAYAWFWLGVAIAAQVGASEGFAHHERWNVWGRGASVLPAVFLAASLHALIIVARRREHGVAPEATRLTAGAAVERAAVGVLSARPSPALTLAHAIASRQRVVRVVGQLPALAAAAPAPIQGLPHPPPEPVPAPVTAPPVARRAPARPAAPVSTSTAAERTHPTGAAPKADLERRSGARDPRWADVVKRCLDGDPPEDAKTVAVDLGIKPRTAQLWVAQERARRSAASRTATAGGSGAGEIFHGGPTPTDAPVPKGIGG